jgi:hypothetical protein
MTVRGYQLAALWSRAGDYTGMLEDVSSYVLDSPEVVAHWGRSEPRATEDAASGSMSFSLRNDGRWFSPENTSSPIAGSVLTGTPVRLAVTDPANGNTTTVFNGPIDDLDVDPNASAKDFTAVCSDGWGKPGDTKLSTPVLQGQRTGKLVQTILDAIGWPSGNAYRSIDWGVTVVPFWWEEGTDASTAIAKIVHSEGPPAIAYVQNGKFFFRDRHHRVANPESLTSLGTYTHTIPAGAVGGDHKILRGSFRYNHGLKNIVNTATIEVTPRAPGPEVVVWSIDGALMLGSGEVRTFELRTDDPFINMQTPDNTLDYTLDSGSVSWSLDRDSGQSATLTMTGGGGGTAISTGLRIRATPLTAGPVQKFSASNPASQATFGTNDWAGEAPWAYYYDAQVVCDRVVGIYSQPSPSISFDVDGVLGAATLTRILGTAVSDRITVRNDELGLNADFMVEQITHTVTKMGVRHVQTIGAQIAEPYQAEDPFVFDTATPLVNGFGNGRFALDVGYNPVTMFRFDVAGVGFDQGVFAA